LCDLRGGGAVAQRVGVDAERLQILKRLASGHITVHLFDDVVLEVGGDARGDLVAHLELARASEGNLHQRHGGPGDVHQRREELRAKPRRVRMRDKHPARRGILF
jgi:hypothetical protein